MHRRPLGRRSLPALTSALILLVLTATAQAEEELRVEKYLAKEVALQHEDGRFAGTRSIDELPKTPVPVQGISDRGALLVHAGDDEIWLDPMDVRLNQQGTIEQLCLSIAKGRSPDRKVAGSMGMGAGCAGK